MTRQVIRLACAGWMVSCAIGVAGCTDDAGESSDIAASESASGGSSGASASGGHASGAAGDHGAGALDASGNGGHGGATSRDAGGDARGGATGRDASGSEVGESPPDYNPCPEKGSPCIIMPLGDSISYGDGSSTHGGYRAPLFHLTLTKGQSITFVGTFMDGPDTVDGVPFPKHHEGHSGYEIAGDHGIAPFTAQAIKGYSPQMVLLMIGTNDIAFNEDPPHAPMRLGALMDIILETDPKLLLVVAQIVPTTDDAKNALVVAFNAEIPALVKARLDAGKHIAMVDMYGALTADASYKTDYMFNEYHPNDAGYVKLAETWYAKIGSLLR